MTFSWKSHFFAFGKLACGWRNVNFANIPKATNDSWRPELQRDSISSGLRDQHQRAMPEPLDLEAAGHKLMLSVRPRPSSLRLQWPFWKFRLLSNTCVFGPLLVTQLCSRCLLHSDIKPWSKPCGQPDSQSKRSARKPLWSSLPISLSFCFVFFIKNKCTTRSDIVSSGAWLDGVTQYWHTY